MKKKEQAVLLLSGGMDSVTLLHYAGKRLGLSLCALTFDYGQKHRRELQAAAWQAAAVQLPLHRVVDLSFFATLTSGASALTDPALTVPDLAQLDAETLTQPPTYVPNRNMILLSIAAAFAESLGVDRVLYGAQCQDDYGYWDCTRPFLDRLNAVLALNRRRAVTVQAPFIGKRKADELRLGLELGVDYAHTWTCYRGETKACGTCPACIERLRAFTELGTPDPLAYC